MDTLTVAAIIALDIALLIAIGIWAARGTSWRLLVGLALSLLFGALVGIPVYVIAVFVTRLVERRRLTPDPPNRIA